MLMVFFFFMQKTAYDMRISDWSSDVCSSDLEAMDAHRRSVEARIGSERTSPTMILTMPLGLALRSTAKHNRCRRYILYQHIFGHGGAYPDDGYFYIGIKARDWQRRWAEHSAAIKRGSRLKRKEERRVGKK